MHSPTSTEVSLAAHLGPPSEPHDLGQLGPFRILRVLGVGGMGVVLLARRPGENADLALKLLKPELAADPKARERFLREVRLAAAFKHPRFVGVQEVGEANGLPFLVMPLLLGQTLEELLTRQPALPMPLVLSIALQVAEGLAALHAAGLLHRDIKPANLWLAPADKGAGSPQVIMLDLGLARSIESDTQMTSTGLVLGTVEYMAPEQARGQAVDCRCDLFSLGCVLYRLCTSAPPFRGSSLIAVLRALALTVPRPPHEVNPEVPGALSTLVMQLLAKDPAQRPASAATVAEILKTLPSDCPNPSHQSPPSVGQIGNPSYEGKGLGGGVWKWSISLAVAASLVIACCLFFWRSPVPPPEKDPVQVTDTDGPALAFDPAFLELARAAEREGRFDEAIAAYQAVIERQPDWPEPHRQLAPLLAASNRLGQAEEAYRRLIQLRPDDAEALCELAGLLQRQDHKREAMERYRAALAANPAWAPASARLALMLLDSNQAQEAATILQAALDRRAATDPLVQMRAALKEEDQATATLVLALLLDGDSMHHVRLVSLGKELADKGRHAAATAVFQKAIALGATTADVHDQLGLSLLAMGKYEAAETALKEAVRLDPMNPKMQFDLALLFLNAGRPKESEQHLRKIIELWPQSHSAYQLLALALHNQGRYDEALAMAYRAVKLCWDSPDAWFFQGELYWGQQKFTQAIASYSKSIELGSKNPLSWYKRGTAYAHSGDPDKALIDYSQAIRMMQKEAAFWRERGALRVLQGKWEEAAIDYDMVIELKSRNLSFWLEYALVQLQLGGPGAYLRACDGLLAHFGKTQDPQTAAGIIWILTLIPGAVSDQETWKHLQEVSARGNNRLLAARAAGMSQCRSGDFRQAIESLQEAVKLAGNEGECRDWLFLALAHAQRKDAATARECLARARQDIDRLAKFAHPAIGKPSQFFWNLHQCQILLEEAEQAVQGLEP